MSPGFTAIGAIPAGMAYLMDISGEEMVVAPDLLASSPLNSFLLPGLSSAPVSGNWDC